MLKFYAMLNKKDDAMGIIAEVDGRVYASCSK
jgi:hypothetical protein